MRITELRTASDSLRTRASARIEWEDSDRPDREMYFETNARWAEDLVPDPNGFLLACALPAARHGERRIFVEGAVCPVLRDGLRSAVELLNRWYGSTRRLPILEPSLGFVAPHRRIPARSALLFSGGVDSLHLVSRNREALLSGDPRFADALWVTAYDAPVEGTGKLNAAISRPLEETGVELLPVSSNLRLLDMDLEFFARESLSASFLSAAHLFGRRFCSISIASTAPAARAVPWGSHPSLDPLFGSAALEIRHEPPAVPRLEKVRSIAAWRTALENLHVCNDEPTEESLNCGTCEKCIESMTELIAAGHPGPWPTFPLTDVTAEAIAGVSVLQDVAAGWEMLPGPLETAGRRDLARAVREKLRERDAVRRWHAGKNWSGRIRRADRRFLGGLLARIYRRL
jgi:hypothetical protein